MKFKIAERVFTVESVDRLTLRHWMRIETETAALGRPMTWTEVRAMVGKMSKLGKKDVEHHPDFPWFIGVVIWASRYTAGESDITFEQAVDFPFGDLEIIVDDADLVTPGGGVGGPRRARPASGRAGKAGTSSKAKKRARSATPSSDA